MRIPIEVGVVIGAFLLAIGCTACFLNRRPGDNDNDDDEQCSCFSAIGRWCKRTIRLGRHGDEDDDDDDESYIGDEESNRPAPHVFDTLNELVFFLAPGDNDGDGDGDGATGLLATTPIKRRSRDSNNNGDNDGDDTHVDHDEDENRLPTTTTMDRIFPDLLGKKQPGKGTDNGGAYLDGGAETGHDGGGLREPLL